MLPWKDNPKLRNDETAVSPVIGVILMVAITVILAAVVAAFVFGVVGEPSAAPQAQVSVDKVSISGDTIKLEHKGGDAIHSQDTRIIVTINGSDTHEWTSATTDNTLTTAGTTTLDVSDGSVTGDWAGSTFTYTNGSVKGIVSGTTVKVQLIDTASEKLIVEREVTAN